ncbi:GL21396 [Drosophila persimilis]|uniref:GL21396 n=1 Tax=Drosophila persimilis TaxID=7234 RepID=B4HAA8_DROPE|nr:GL21396 [Drosophila persimilis]
MAATYSGAGLHYLPGAPRGASRCDSCCCCLAAPATVHDSAAPAAAAPVCTAAQSESEQDPKPPQAEPSAPAPTRLRQRAGGTMPWPAPEHPIFIYNGTRGEMILNTMLSGQRYPMQEPVPGQVLYPPSTPMFRPKPIVERFRMPGQRQLLNLTLIPFYAHEAITTSSSTSSTTTELPPTTPLPTSYETQLPRSQKKRKRKKAKQYNAFHSPQEVVQWQSVLRRSTGDNHRHYSGSDAEQQLEEEEEPQEEETQVQNWLTEDDPPEAVEEVEQQEISTSTSVSPFQIVYFDESLERPESDALDSTTISPPQRLSSRYALKREYYAFPVYTLGKLLQPQHQSQSQLQIESQVEEKQEKIERSARSSSEQAPSTWFILNSRYKGPHHRWPGMGTDNHTKYYTSKYIESAFRPRR